MPQTLAAALFLKKSEISFSNVPGYMYRDAAICPSNINHFAELRCTCNPGEYKGTLITYLMYNNIYCSYHYYYYVC